MMDRWLGLVALAASLLTLFVWIPLDVDTGIIEKARRSTVLGDSFAPAVAAALVAIGGLLLLIERPPKNSVAMPQDVATTESAGSLQLANVKFLLATFLILSLSLLVMRYAGPLLVALVGEEGASYRLLRDTPPWKYVGFVFGGVLLITGLISWVEKRFRFRFLVIGLATVLVLIAIYDLPFDDLLLPPNGDV